MTKVTLELSEGDWVVHNRHGLGQIIGMDTKELLGDRKVFYVVKTESITYWLPIAESNSVRIRPVASADAFQLALKLMEETPQPLEDNFRRRLAAIQSEIQKSTLLSKAALIRDMYARDYQKDVHINEKKILDTLQQQFINEWVATGGIQYEEAQDALRKALKKSVANLKEKRRLF